MWSEAIKILKGEYTVRAIKEHKMDQAIIFCRTKIDCDNMEQYFMQQGGGSNFMPVSLHFVYLQGDTSLQIFPPGLIDWFQMVVFHPGYFP